MDSQSIKDRDLEGHDEVSFEDPYLNQVNEDSITPRQIPYFTILFNTMNWIIYVYALIKLVKWENVDVNTISPPDKAWWFFTVQWWPNCSDSRQELWRLLSYQFVHAGFVHIIGNTLCGFFYGAILELFHQLGFMITVVIYELSIIFGALGHSYFYPFVALIGCSPGVYGLIGAVASFNYLYSNKIGTRTYNYIRSIIVIQLIAEMFCFYFMYNPNIGYSSHVCGFFTGLSAGLSFGLFDKYHLTNSRVSIGIGFIFFSVFITFFLFQYIYNWPPFATTHSNSLFRPKLDNSCCADAFYLSYQNHYSLDYIISNSVCSGTNLVFTDPSLA
eukprot:gene11348-15215_t